MTPDSLELSPRLRGAATAEQRRLQREINRVESRLATIEDEATGLRARHASLREKLRVLEILSTHEPAKPPRRGKTEASVAAPMLRGADIREVAVRVLVESMHSHRAIHYRTWYGLVVDRGISIGGKHPEASFLTQLTRSPVVDRGPTAGTYLINWSFPERARLDLDELRSELERTYNGPSAPAPNLRDLDAVHERRKVLRSRIAQLERRLQEALRSLAAADSALDAA